MIRYYLDKSSLSQGFQVCGLKAAGIPAPSTIITVPRLHFPCFDLIALLKSCCVEVLFMIKNCRTCLKSYFCGVLYEGNSFFFL